jgi:hypothetical protein
MRHDAWVRWPSDPPRRHHYGFAHQVLPSLARQPGIDLPAMAVAGLLDDALASAWADVGRQLPEAERLPADGLHGCLVDAGGTAVVLVTLPPAERTTEAHLAAVIPGDEPGQSRYLVLEHSWTMDGEPATVLGEWVTGPEHRNLGPGPAPDPGSFTAALAGLLTSADR